MLGAYKPYHLAAVFFGLIIILFRFISSVIISDNPYMDKLRITEFIIGTVTLTFMMLSLFYPETELTEIIFLSSGILLFYGASLDQKIKKEKKEEKKRKAEKEQYSKTTPDPVTTEDNSVREKQ